VILAIVYTPAGHWLFGTSPIGLRAWLLALLFAGGMWVLEEVRKAWVRRAQLRALRPDHCGSRDA
jgi:hypothetical protein